MCYVELHSRYVPRLLDTSWFSLSRYLSKYLVIYQYNLQFTYEVKSDKKLSIKGCCDAQNHACLPCHVAAANNTDGLRSCFITSAPTAWLSCRAHSLTFTLTFTPLLQDLHGRNRTIIWFALPPDNIGFTHHARCDVRLRNTISRRNS